MRNTIILDDSMCVYVLCYTTSICNNSFIEVYYVLLLLTILHITMYYVYSMYMIEYVQCLCMNCIMNMCGCTTIYYYM